MAQNKFKKVMKGFFVSRDTLEINAQRKLLAHNGGELLTEAQEVQAFEFAKLQHKGLTLAKHMLFERCAAMILLCSFFACLITLPLWNDMGSYLTLLGWVGGLTVICWIVNIRQSAKLKTISEDINSFRQRLFYSHGSEEQVV